MCCVFIWSVACTLDFPTFNVPNDCWECSMNSLWMPLFTLLFFCKASVFRETDVILSEFWESSRKSLLTAIFLCHCTCSPLCFALLLYYPRILRMFSKLAFHTLRLSIFQWDFCRHITFVQFNSFFICYWYECFPRIVVVHKHWSTYIVHCKWSVLMDTVNYVTILIWITFPLFACAAVSIDLQARYTRCLLYIYRNCWSSCSFTCSLCVSLNWTLYHTLLDGRSNFVDFYWGLWRDSVMVNLCILWRFLVTWIHANILTAHLVRELFRHQGPYFLHLTLWRFPRIFSGFALFILRCQVVRCTTLPCYQHYAITWKTKYDYVFPRILRMF